MLGLRLSDSSEGNVAFMHGPHGSDHHMVAFARSGGPGLHHCSWDVGAVQEIGLGAMQMAGKGYTAGWGLGRHVLGSNYFHYVRDPWGSYSEYSADMDYIPADHDWRSGDHPGENYFLLWGPNPPEDFVRNYEIDTCQQFVLRPTTTIGTEEQVVAKFLVTLLKTIASRPAATISIGSAVRIATSLSTACGRQRRAGDRRPAAERGSVPGSRRCARGAPDTKKMMPAKEQIGTAG